MDQHATDFLKVAAEEHWNVMTYWFGQRIRGFGWLFAALFLTSPSVRAADAPADLIVTHARVYTVNVKQPWAEAMAVSGEHITAIGTNAEIEKLRGPKTRVLDAAGKLLLPSFTDCHIHFLEGALTLTQVDLNGVASIAAAKKRVKEFADAHPNAPWIMGRGWSYEIFGKAALPDRRYLDAVVPDRPVYLIGFDGHTSWVNSKALAVTGITRDTPNPTHGEIIKDDKGEPTGALTEDADDLVAGKAPKPTRAEQLDALRLGMREANRVGLVRLHSASNSQDSVGDLQNLDAYDELRRAGQLTIRMYAAANQPAPALTPEQIAVMEKARQQYHDDWISAGAVKFFMDGVVESHTAAMLTPYSDDPSKSGELRWDESKYKQAVTELDKRGFQIFTHSIGERAVRVTFDAYEQAAKVNGTSDRRHRIEHIETISAQDIPRFGKLGVIPSFQPLHAEPNADTLNVWAKNAGPDRASRGWPWQSIAKSGGRLAFGSDWPVVTLNPWHGVQNALTRQTQAGKPRGGWLPEQRLTLEQAIEGYTLGAAFAGHRETSEGSLEPGKLADFIILDRDLFNTSANEVYKTQVLMTVAGGKVVYQSAAFLETHRPESKSGGNAQ